MAPETAGPASARAGFGAALRDRLGLLRSLWLYRRPGRQRGLRRLYRPFVGRGDLVFDIGAHVGDRTRAFRSLGARVVALEPHPELAARLARALAADDAVAVVRAAVGAGPGRATLHASRATPTVSSLDTGWIERLGGRNRRFAGVRWDRPVEVRVTTLDALIEDHGVPAFCKIDVEGHEAAVLAGLSAPVDALSFEFVAGALDAARACVDELERLAAYDFNVVAGERRRMLWPDWRRPEELRGWLDAGADGLASGDVYARRRGAAGRR